MHLPCTFSALIDQARFDRFAGLLARDFNADMLLSADGYPAQTRSVVGMHPVAELVVTKTTTPGQLKDFCFGSPGPALGFLSYTYGMILRGVPSSKSYDFPLGHLKKYETVISFENREMSISAHDQSVIDMLSEMLKHMPEEHDSSPVTEQTFSGMVTSLDKAGYEDGVRRTLDYIRSGHTYQLNLSTRFSWHCPELDPLSLFMTLRRKHPAPFYAWLISGRKRILSTSPERYLAVQNGHVLSQPIKGTLHFDTLTPEAHRQLTDSPKESAELSMIVDLVRNDISTNCEYGSVHVKNHKSVFAVDNLLQMYSDVHGTLRNDRDCLDLFLDAFPGGSVTGCPKKSSMEIIEQLEPHSRGLYCGSILIIEDERNMDSSIAIRTATFDTETKMFNSYAGSGIVMDSDPVREYLETIAKAEKFLVLGE
ncbi:anthranilate synthase component I family protein [uncultured Pseudodesulfovibrio sp.]|uniref:anthranilate synthase component I family protein n=1 Tax=uncultured Pseudodesulfovibrio sp. TaxID=2035858 RepID=UPI0029C735B3|nr:anthranilate synthase component I family protein [uncultured Pseudodesulfovibrio sp.]